MSLPHYVDLVKFHAAFHVTINHLTMLMHVIDSLPHYVELVKFHAAFHVTLNHLTTLLHVIDCWVPSTVVILVVNTNCRFVRVSEPRVK